MVVFLSFNDFPPLPENPIKRCTLQKYTDCLDKNTYAFMAQHRGEKNAIYLLSPRGPADHRLISVSPYRAEEFI